MHEIVLPTSEETSVALTIGETSFTLDYFQHMEYVNQAYQQMRNIGVDSNDVMAECLAGIYKEQHGVSMSVGVTKVLMGRFDKVEEELKKKFSTLQEVFGSLDSPGPQKQNEISNSSNTQESA